MTEPKSSLAQIRQFRIDKVEKLRKLGINPYPTKSDRDTVVNKVIENFDELEGKEVTIAGRLMSWREHGHLIFGHIQDQSGKVQLYIKDDQIEETSIENQTLGFTDLSLIDIGDIVEATGIVTKTQRGEISVMPKKFKILTKALRPLPDKWEGIKDKETRYRRRYLDMTINPETRKIFERRGKFWNAVRQFLIGRGFDEVNIPVLEHTTGGADAKPFVTHMNALNEDFYLRISHELPLKKLLGAGFERVFDIGPRFRNEGVDDEHLPEHVAMEWYWGYADMKMGMDLTVDLFRFIAKEVYGSTKFENDKYSFDLSDEWEILEFSEILKERFGVDVYNDSDEKIIQKFRDETGDKSEIMNKSRAADGLWKLIRKEIHGPAFLVGVPKFLSPLAKSSADNPERTDRFHPVIAGSELANAFGELNDPQDQYERFIDQQKLRESGDDEAHMLDIDFVEMLEFGMPPAVGFGLSERVFWSFEGISAREGVPFPAMKRHFEPTTLELYDEKYLISTESKSENTKIDSSDAKVSSTQDFSNKIVIIVNKELESWQITNAVAHTSAYIGHKLNEKFDTGENFITKDEANHPRNTQYPIIILTAKPGQMSNLMTKVRESELLYHGFIKEMIDTSDDQEITKILATKDDSEIEYLGIGVFGSNDEVNKLTKKFSMFK